MQLKQLTSSSSISTEAQTDLRYLQSLLPERKAGYRSRLAAELEALAAGGDEKSPPVRLRAHLFTSRQMNAQMASDKVLQQYLSRFLSLFLASEGFALICSRFDQSPANGATHFSPRNIQPWFIIWLLQTYPALSQVLLSNRPRQYYSGLSTLPYEQMMMYLPRFVLYRLERLVAHPPQLIWIRWMAGGNNIRKARHLPFPLTRRMAHWLTQAPDYASFGDAFLYAQVRGLNGSEDLFGQLRQFFREEVGDYAFREEIIRLLVQHDRPGQHRNFTRLLGYLQHRRHEDHDFRLRGRQLPRLLREAEAWHEEQRLQRSYQYRQAYQMIWNRVEIEDFILRQGRKEYRILQLTTGRELVEEGAAMGHCVATYSSQAKAGQCSIWSLRRFEKVNDEWQMERLVTIELSREGAVVQARAKYNAMPREQEQRLIRKWTMRAGLTGDRF